MVEEVALSRKHLYYQVLLVVIMGLVSGSVSGLYLQILVGSRVGGVWWVFCWEPLVPSGGPFRSFLDTIGDVYLMGVLCDHTRLFLIFLCA